MYLEADITVLSQEWIYLQKICRWQRRYENVKKSAAKHTDTAEYIYGLKNKAFITILNNPKTILRVMQKYSLLSVVRRKKYRNYRKYLHRYPNLLNRDFKAERPNQKWVTDISYIKIGQGFLYLSIIRDLYDNSIVAYKTGTEQNVNLVLSTIRAAKKKEKVTAEYSSIVTKAFNTLLISILS